MSAADDHFGRRLAVLLDEASSDVVLTPQLLERAHRGGERRLRRRRMVVAAQFGLLALLLAAAPALPGAIHRATRGPAKLVVTRAMPSSIGRLYDAPSRGNRIHDKAFVREVVSTWTASHGTSALLKTGVFQDLLGEPKVVWAGQTPIGPAALVEQRAYWHAKVRVDDSEAGLVTLVGFIGVDTQGRPRLVEDTYNDDYGAWYVDTARTTLVVIDQGRDLAYANGYTIHSNGAWTLDYIPLRFTQGAAVIQPPARTDGQHFEVSIVVLPGESQYVGIAGQFAGDVGQGAQTAPPSPSSGGG